VLFGENGLPVDSIATISGSHIFIEGVDPISYSGGTVTLPVGSDLTSLTTAKARYTGKYILLTNDDRILYIDRLSIDIATRTFVVSTSDKITVFPTTVDTSAGWKVAEADIVNRLATTSAAKIDSIEFRDLHFQMELDGDPVTVIDENGDIVDFATEATQQDNNQELRDINDELDTISVSLSQIDDSISKNYVGTPTIVNTTLVVQGVEYSIALPSTVKRFMVKSRTSSTLNLTYISNSSSILTIHPGTVYTEDNLVTTSSLTLYLKSNKPNTVIETVYWE
jgi:hypothetical protein